MLLVRNAECRIISLQMNKIRFPLSWSYRENLGAILLYRLPTRNKGMDADDGVKTEFGHYYPVISALYES